MLLAAADRGDPAHDACRELLETHPGPLITRRQSSLRRAGCSTDSSAESYNYWHALRPLIGVITGGVGCLLLLATTELATSGSKAMNPDIYYAVAFLVGFAEATFRDLIKRLTDVLFGPGKTKPKTDTTGHADSDR